MPVIRRAREDTRRVDYLCQSPTVGIAAQIAPAVWRVKRVRSSSCEESGGDAGLSQRELHGFRVGSSEAGQAFSAPCLPDATWGTPTSATKPRLRAFTNLARPPLSRAWPNRCPPPKLRSSPSSRAASACECARLSPSGSRRPRDHQLRGRRQNSPASLRDRTWVAPRAGCSASRHLLRRVKGRREDLAHDHS